MDALTFLGIIVSFGAILIGQYIEGGHIHSLLNLPAFLIVLGGTIGASMVQTPGKVFRSALSVLTWVFIPPVTNFDAARTNITNMAKKSRQFGLIALEESIDKEPDMIIKKGIELLVVGIDKLTIRHILEQELTQMEEYALQNAKVYEAMGGYAPTIGILGAVLGLIHVMQNLSDPGTLGAGIAVAFVATIYGVGMANLLFLPIANKLKAIVSRQVLYYEMIIEGVVAIAGGESPNIIALKLKNYDKRLEHAKKKGKR